VNALNVGKSGNTSHDALNVLLNHVVHDRPDAAVLMEAANDFGVLLSDPMYRTRGGAPMTAALPLRWLLQEGSSHSAMLGALRAWLTVRGPAAGDFRRRAHEGSAPTAPFAQRLRAFVGLCRAFDITPLLMTQPYAPTRTALTPEWTNATDQERFNDVIRAVAMAERIALIDLAGHVYRDVADWDRPMHVFYDGIHVTSEGARIYAEYVTDRLLQEVPALRAEHAARHEPSAGSR
jgi:lysophospholipase L1-like esterase